MKRNHWEIDVDSNKSNSRAVHPLENDHTDHTMCGKEQWLEENYDNVLLINLKVASKFCRGSWAIWYMVFCQKWLGENSPFLLLFWCI